MEISKELLSLVLRKKIVSDDGITYYTKSIAIDFDNDITSNAYEEINIHELAHKCKEWAYDKGYILSSSKDDDNMWYCEINKEELCMGVSKPTEPEAIFKACQWILDRED